MKSRGFFSALRFLSASRASAAMAAVTADCSVGGSPFPRPSRISIRVSRGAPWMKRRATCRFASHWAMASFAAARSLAGSRSGAGWETIRWAEEAGLPGYREFHPFGHMERSLSTQCRSLGVATARNFATSPCLHPARRSAGGVRHSSIGMASNGKATHVIGSGSSARARWKKSSARLRDHQCCFARAWMVLTVWPTYHFPVGKWYTP